MSVSIKNLGCDYIPEVTYENYLGKFNIETEKMRLVKTLTPAQKKLSPCGCWNDTLLIECLVNDWSLEKWNLGECP